MAYVYIFILLVSGTSLISFRVGRLYVGMAQTCKYWKIQKIPSKFWRW